MRPPGRRRVARAKPQPPKDDPVLLALLDDLGPALRDVILRRRASTGETLEDAARAVLAFLEKNRAELAAAPDGWAAAWLAEPARDPSPLERESMRAQPPWMKAMLLRFPPNCLVRTKGGFHHMVPAKGCPAIVIGYGEGMVTVLPYPTAQTAAQCLAEAVELVGCWRGWTPERVRQILGGLS